MTTNDAHDKTAELLALLNQAEDMLHLNHDQTGTLSMILIVLRRMLGDDSTVRTMRQSD